MDELIRHLVDQIAVDGASGITAAQFKDHVQSFVDQQHDKQRREEGLGDSDDPTAASAEAIPKQVIDDAFLGFVWKRLSRLPHILVGRHVPASAAQPRTGAAEEDEDDDEQGEQAKGKAKKRKKKGSKGDRDLCSVPRDSVDVDKDARALSLAELQQSFGDELRIVVDEATRREMLAGPAHASISPTAWTVLQLVMTYREEGVSLGEITQKTGLDTKAAFYQLTKMLGARNLVVLVKQIINKQLANVAIARRFCHLSKAWLQHQRMNSEVKRLNGPDEGEDGAEDEEGAGDDDGGHDAAEGAQAVRDAASASTLITDDKGLVCFSQPIPTRVSPEAVVRVRLLRMLHHSPNHITPLDNMWRRLGLAPERRKSTMGYINAMEDEGLVERVTVLPEVDARPLTCLRLSEKGLAHLEDAANRGPASGSLDEKRAERLRTMLSLSRPGLLCGEVVWERQIAEYVANTGMQGATIDDLARDFHFTNRGKRFIDTALTFLKTHVSTPAYADLELFPELEQSGRMRSYRYLTRQAFIHRGFVRPELGLSYEALEAIPKDPDALRRFSNIEGDQSSTDPEQLTQRMLDFAQIAVVRNNGFEVEEADVDEDVGPSKKGKGKAKAATTVIKKKARASTGPATPKQYKNPIDPITGKRKRGRPPKQAVVVDDANHTSAKGETDSAAPAQGPSRGQQQQDEAASSTTTPRAKRRKGQSKKQDGAGPASGETQTETAQATTAEDGAAAEVSMSAARPRRGRRGKEPEVDEARRAQPAVEAAAAEADTSEPATPQSKRQRGRPRKHPLPEESETDAAGTPVQASQPATPVPAQSRAAIVPIEIGSTDSATEAESTPSGQRLSSRKRTKTAKALALEAERSRGPRSQGNEDDEAPAATSPRGSGIASKSQVTAAAGDTAPAAPSSPGPQDSSQADEPTEPESDAQPQLADSSNALGVSPYVERYIASTKRPDKDKKATPTAARLNTATRRRQVAFAQYMEQRRVVDITEANKDFHAYVAEREGEAIADELSLTDTRTRRSIIDSLVADGALKTTSVMQIIKHDGSAKQLKNPSHPRLRVIIYVPDIDEQELHDFCTDVQTGKEGNAWRRKDAAKPRKSKTDLGTVDIGVKEGAFKKKRRAAKSSPDTLQRRRRRDFFDENNLEKLSLDELLSDTTRSVVLAKVTALRQHLGVPKGLARQLQLLHEELVVRATQASGDDDDDHEYGTVDVAKMIFDMPLSNLLHVLPPAQSNETLIRAWDEETNRSNPVGHLHEGVIKSMGIKKGHLPSRMEDRIRLLNWLGLLEVEDATSDNSRFVVRLNLDGVTQLGFTPQATPYRIDGSERLRTVDEVRAYWTSLRQYSVVTKHMERSALKSTGGEEKELRKTLYNALRDKREWRSASKVMITLGQSALIRRIVEVCQEGDKLNDVEVAERLVRVTALPAGVIVKFLNAHLHMELFEGHALLKLAPKQGSPEDTQEITAIRGRVGTKAKQAAKRRAAKWDGLLAELFSIYELSQEQRDECRSALKSYRKRYIREPELLPDLEIDRHITTAIVKVLKPLRIKSARRADKAPITRKAKEKRDRDEGRTEQEGGRRKRNTTHRIEWNKDREELLRDACIILRARDKERTGSRKNWTALSQLFPNSGVASNHFNMLEDKIGERPYLEQLEKEWTEIWRKYRGTRWLRDDTWPHHCNFDLSEHIDFLRDRIDKNKVLDTIERAGIEPLPLDVGLLNQTWDYDKAAPINSARMWDTLFNNDIEASAVIKNQLLHENSFAIPWQQPRDAAAVAELPEEASMERQRIDESVVRMVLASDEETLKSRSEDLQRFIALNAGKKEDDAAAEAVRRLAARSIVTMPAKDDTRAPGSNVRYTDKARNALVENLLVKNSTVELIRRQKEELEGGKEGDYLVFDPDRPEVPCAAMLELICDGEVEVDPHLESLAPLRDDLFLNVKKMNDDEAEMVLGFRLVPEAIAAAAAKRKARAGKTRATPSAPPFALDKSEATINRAWATAVKKDADLGLLRDELFKAGAAGLTLKRIREGSLSHLSVARLAEVVQLALDPGKPLAFATGYDVPRMVHASFVAVWTVETLAPRSSEAKGKGAKQSPSSATTRRIVPRAWLDIYGAVNEDTWTRAVEIVVSWARNRPGMLLSQLVDVLSPALDRPDVVDVVHAACEAGLVRRFFSGSCDEEQEGEEARLLVAEDDEVGIELA